MNGWPGEIHGLQVTLDTATRKLVSLDRIRDRQPAGPVSLGVPPSGNHKRRRTAVVGQRHRNLLTERRTGCNLAP